MEINIKSDLARLEKSMGAMARQLPFATALAINDTMVDVQTELRERTFPKAWENRNKSLAKAATMLPRAERATKKRLKATLTPARGRDGRLVGEGFLNRQISGQTKTPRGSRIAIPVLGPGMRRLKGGAISKAKRPRANSKLIKIASKKRKGVDLLVERQKRKGIIVRYVLAKKARGTSNLSRYYPDAKRVANQRMPINWKKRIAQAVATAKP